MTNELLFHINSLNIDVVIEIDENNNIKVTHASNYDNITIENAVFEQLQNTMETVAISADDELFEDKDSIKEEIKELYAKINSKESNS